jgi:phosphinothricin acetyltransferase
MTAARIRPAVDADAHAIADIYNHYIRTSTATFDTEEKSIEDRIAWLAEHTGPHPALVAEHDGEVIAWGALTKWGTRCAYAHSVEISVYVRPQSTRTGTGPQLAEALVAQARVLGHHAIISQIVSENEPSLKMAERMGFERAGTLREVGRKFDRWLDVVMMQLILSGGDAPAAADTAVSA